MAKFPVNLSKVKDAWSEVGALTDRSASILLAGDSRLVALAQGVLELGLALRGWALRWVLLAEAYWLAASAH